MLKNPIDDARALLDGGWTLEDFDEIAAQYNLDQEEATQLYEAMEYLTT